jgi:hypothetical protein
MIHIFERDFWRMVRLRIFDLMKQLSSRAIRSARAKSIIPRHGISYLHAFDLHDETHRPFEIEGVSQI